MYLSWREIRHSKLRYLLIGGIVMLITWLVFMISGLANGLASDNASAVQNLPVKSFIMEHSDDHRLERSALTSDKVKKALPDHASKGISPFGVHMTSVSAKNGDQMDVSLFAVQGSSNFAPNVSEGDTLKEGNGVVVDASLKDKGVKIGDTLKTKDSSDKLKVGGFTNQSYSYSHTPVVFMNLNQWEKMQGGHARYNAILVGENASSDIQPASGLDRVDSSEVLENVPGFQAEQGTLKMMIGFLLVITAFVLAVFFYVITLQKIDQYGVLKAIGTKTGYLTKTLMSQISMISIAAIIVGIILSLLVAQIIPSGMPFTLSVQTIVFDGLLMLVMALIGALISLFRIAKVDPVDAIGA